MTSEIKILDAQHAWGYHWPDDFRNTGWGPKYRKVLYTHNAFNAASIILSPLIGLIRAITAIIVLIILKTKTAGPDGTESEEDGLPEFKRLMWMQLGRAGLELLCLGAILGTVVDGIMTLKHKEMLCFKNS